MDSPHSSQARCLYCDLPVTASDQAEAYCCYGCRFAHAVVRERHDDGGVQWTVIRLGLAVFFTMNLMAFTMTMWSLDVYDVNPDPFQLTLYAVFRWLSLLLAIPVLLLLGTPLVQNCADSIRQRRFSTDALILLAVAAAFVTSTVSLLADAGPIYFEVGAMVLVMMTLGRWIEAAGRQQATRALDQLDDLLPTEAIRLTANGNHTIEQTISSQHIQNGDLLRVRAGARLPVDGILLGGRTCVDEQVFTGESVPCEKQPGDRLLAGTVNIEGDIQLRATAKYREGTFGKLLQTLQDARDSQGHYQRLTERITRWFLPLVAAISILTFLIHLSGGLPNAIHAALAVLLIACPCALGLATPLAVWTSLSTAARHQVLFRSAEAIEKLADAGAVCFDKTGTLTTGSPQILQLATFDELSETDLATIHLLADSSSHPFSRAIVAYFDEVEFEASHATTVETSVRPATVAGGGIELNHGEKTFRLGSLAFACCSQNAASECREPNLCVHCPTRAANGPASQNSTHVPLSTRVPLDRLRMAADEQAASIVLYSVNGRPLCGFLVSETLRPEAADAIAQTESLVGHVRILTGDREARGQFLREQLPRTGTVIHSQLSPQQKVEHVRRLQAQGLRTVMVGDGINDAPALATSHVGIAPGCGADISRDAAQVCILSDNLTHIPWAIRHARRTRHIIRQNLWWAFSYNAAGIVAAASGSLNPAFAAALMIFSSLVVISNSLRLLRDEWPAYASGQSISQQTPPTEQTMLKAQPRECLS
ncbi:MAG: cation-translocating P-type ATPase [Planctomycetaceae bacterium]|nr:cation-translocating P-type ATPase [Planctomycetaceae bacterium]